MEVLRLPNRRACRCGKAAVESVCAVTRFPEMGVPSSVALRIGVGLCCAFLREGLHGIVDGDRLVGFVAIKPGGKAAVMDRER